MYVCMCVWAYFQFNAFIKWHNYMHAYIHTFVDPPSCEILVRNHCSLVVGTATSTYTATEIVTLTYCE